MSWSVRRWPAVRAWLPRRRSLRRFEVVSESGCMALFDGRHRTEPRWFVLREVIQPGVTTDAIVWRLTVNAIPEWRRAPVIGISQVGYHPDQVKQAILELDPRDRIVELCSATDRVGKSDAGAFVPTGSVGRWLRWTYAIFDFSAVQEPGFYRVRYADQATPGVRDPSRRSTTMKCGNRCWRRSFRCRCVMWR